MLTLAPALVEVNSLSPADVALALRESIASECGEFIPSVADQYHETGRSIGLDGGNCSVYDAFPNDSGTDWLAGEKAFYAGLLEGRRLFAERAGHAAGLNKKPCERPATIHRRFDREFRGGWESGNAERIGREAEMGAYFQQLDWDHAYECEMRDAELFNRQMFYGRCASMVD